MKKHIVFITCLVLIDLITKELFKNKFYDFKLFAINYTTNTGALFGFLKNFNLMLIFVTLIIMVFIIFYYRREKKFQLGFDFILAGAFGNLVNRLQYHFVIDFIDFKIWPVFNFGDVFIFVGVILILFIEFRKK